MAAEIEFNDKISSAIQGILNRVKDIRGGATTFVKLLNMIVLRDIDQHFKDESEPTGKWRDWSPSYRQSLIDSGAKVTGKKNKTAKILQRTGRLRNSMTPGRYSSGGVLWTARTEYANRHDKGTNGMPQRQFMWLSDVAVENLSQQMINFALSKEK